MHLEHHYAKMQATSLVCMDFETCFKVDEFEFEMVYGIDGARFAWLCRTDHQPPRSLFSRLFSITGTGNEVVKILAFSLSLLGA